MSKDSRNRILDTATRLIHLRGYQATSVEDILIESEVSKGSFFHHFKSKEEMGLAVVERLKKNLQDQLISPAFQNDLVPMDKINKMLDLELELFQKNGSLAGCPLGNLANEMANNNEKFRLVLSEIFSQWMNTMKLTLDLAKTQATLPESADTETLARFILTSLEGAFLLMKTNQSLQPLEQTIQSLKLYLIGLTIKPVEVPVH